jgi:hypothetical protein
VVVAPGAFRKGSTRSSLCTANDHALRMVWSSCSCTGKWVCCA